MSLLAQPVRSAAAAKIPDFINDRFVVCRGNRQDLEALAKYHHCPGSAWPATDIFKLIGKSPYRTKFADPVGVVVYRLTIPTLSGRNEATDNFFLRPGNQSDNLRLVNEKIRYAARIIIDPRYRRIGLAKKLQSESLDQMTVPIVETLCPLDWTSKLLRYSGYLPYYNRPPKRYERLKKKLLSLGLTEQSLDLPAVVEERLQSLGNEKTKLIDKEIRRFLGHWRDKYDWTGNLERTSFFLDKLEYPNVYWVWKNPKIPLLS